MESRSKRQFGSNSLHFTPFMTVYVDPRPRVNERLVLIQIQYVSSACEKKSGAMFYYVNVHTEKYMQHHRTHYCADPREEKPDNGHQPDVNNMDNGDTSHKTEREERHTYTNAGENQNVQVLKTVDGVLAMAQ